METPREDIKFPSDSAYRMMRILEEDMDTRLKELTYLVSLQESELAFHWLLTIGIIIYLVKKERRVR